jgi:predicted nuclease of restriction endonuclease-like RecB superfamily
MISHAQDYSVYLKKANTNRDKFKLILSAHISDLKAFKSNIGIEMAELVLMQPDFTLPREQREEVIGYWKAWKENETLCSGLEKLIEAKSSKISFAQSQMKYIKDNT